MLPHDWQAALDELQRGHGWSQPSDFVSGEREVGTVYPPPDEVFRAFELTPFADVRVVILGQDPYHGESQAHGLAFSVAQGRIPPSLRKIFLELERDPDVAPPPSGNLEGWARQGVLLLNTVLTVRAGSPNSHRNSGWEEFTDAVIDAVNSKPDRVVFLLWGTSAQKKARKISNENHVVIRVAHPAARANAKSQLVGSGCFLRTNTALRTAGIQTIEWHRPA